VNVHCIVPSHQHTSKAQRYGTRSQGISQFYLHTPHSSSNGIYHTRLFLINKQFIRSPVNKPLVYVVHSFFLSHMDSKPSAAHCQRRHNTS